MKIKDKTNDFCIRCGKKIVYDKEDGYWDSFHKTRGDIHFHTPECSETQYHEPTNFTSDKNGFYYKNPIFKIGDKVKLVKKIKWTNSARKGTVGEILKLGLSIERWCYWVSYKNGGEWWYEDQVKKL